jgi:DNA-binding transcriptional LysR family regulator
MDQLSLLRTFAAVAEAGQFAKAADRLGLSRAMASKHVMDLEAHLGARLFNRTTRRVRLTDTGAAYLEKCRDILAALDEANREVSAQAQEPVGRLRISAPMSLGQSRLAPVIAAYAKKYPRVSVELSLTDRVVDLVEEGFDLAVRVGRLADSSLISRRIGSVRIHFCASPDYLSAHGRPAAPQDLSAHDCLQYSYVSGWDFLIDGRLTSVQTRGRVQCNNGDALCRMAVAGAGIVGLPDFIVAPFIENGRLAPVLAEFAPQPLGIFVLHTTQRHVPLKLRTMVDFLAAAFAREGV